MAALVLVWGAAVTAVLYVAIRLLPMYLEIRRMRRLTAKVPQPPLNTYLDFAMGVSVDDLYDRLYELLDRWGPHVCGWLGPYMLFGVMDPYDMEAVMSNPKCNDKSGLYRAVEPITGTGLVVINGADWRRHRKAMSPSLHLDVLQGFVEVFHERGLWMAEQLEALADSGGVLNVTPVCGMCATSSVCQTVLSMDKDWENPGEERDRLMFIESISKAMDHFVYRVLYPWFLNEHVYSWSKRFPEYAAIRSYSDRYISRIIERKRAQLASGKEPPAGRRRSFLDHMLVSVEGAALNTKEMIEEVKTLMASGSSTSMDALSLLLQTLARRQDVQEKVVQELNDIYGDDPARPVVASDLSHMNYLERVIKEVLRYFPVVPFFARRCEEDVHLPSGHVAPRGCHLSFWLPFVHMNPRYFPEPRKFDPDRFLPENARSRHPYAYTPFSAGQRNCIGQRYAMLFLKAITATVLRKVRLLPEPGGERLEDVKLAVTLTLQIRGGSNVRAERRTSLGKVPAPAPAAAS